MRRPKPDNPGPGQTSVWTFPRPPSIERETRTLRVVFDGREVARSARCVKVLETSHPPVYFFPPEDVDAEMARDSSEGGSFCEWKGRARYHDVVSPSGEGDRVARAAAFSYPTPFARFLAHAGWLSFYAGPMDACWVDDERVTPQPGGFYSGWITSDLAGPFKGVEGSWGW
ncbi:MAG: DUF427 domain-containing protein [Planctomycetota bacterium]